MGQLCHKSIDKEDSGSESDSASDGESASSETKPTEVPDGVFSAPEPLGRSGGTARFYRLDYVGPSSGALADAYGKSEDRWIGKDLAHAKDELWFYEQIATLDTEDFQLLHRWCMPYGGILTARCATGSKGTSDLESERRRLLLLGNVRSGTLNCRFLDIKIGEETAVAGWKGKSGYAAVRGRMLDRYTNSILEGFRLEGFDNMPIALQTQAEGAQGVCLSVEKKSRRFQLQRLTALDFLLHWIDHSELASPLHDRDPDILHPIEYSECILFDACRQLAELCADALTMPVPQMWIGSSLALACEGAMLPRRQKAHEMLASRSQASAGLARAHIFDWGRSELNTGAAHAERLPGCQQMRQSYWNIWLRGAIRILYDCVVLYRRQFSSRLTSRRSLIVIEVYDYDVMKSNDLIGCASLPLKPTSGQQSLRLLRSGSHGEIALDSEVDVSIDHIDLPDTSRLSQAWRVTVHCVRKLPWMDTFSKTDPLVVIKVVTPGSDCIPEAATPVIWNNNNAVFDWNLEFGEVRQSLLDQLFDELSSAFEEPMDMSMFPTTVVGHTHVQQRWFEAFLDRVKKLQHLSRAVGQRADSRLIRWGSGSGSPLWSFDD